MPREFDISTIANVSGARELAVLPNGDVLAGTTGNTVAIVPDAQGYTAGRPLTFAQLPDDRASGVAFSASRCEVYIGTEHGIYAAQYAIGETSAHGLHRIAAVRTGPVAPHSDGDVHTTTSVVFSDESDALYFSVGSSCNACTEADPTRASVFRLGRNDTKPVKIATRIRNAIALAIDPERNALWVGDAGQDDLPFGHPYEFLDDASAHAGVADYGWPQCEENRKPYVAGANCSKTVTPLAVLPAYSTIVGAAFYPPAERGRYAFPQRYRGGLFAAAHGSWHRRSDAFAAEPQVAFFAMRAGRPARPVDWRDSTMQWQRFVGSFQSGSSRSGRPTGVAVGTDGSLFVADDSAGAIYRIRPR